ncbi:acetyl-CoA carboxylase biotin carboxylase subunit [Candidatus Bipolaricaulota bacterium]|nr:acetyl-CoA carboxylase biotin carboxylase subunit [Candidatus Bipolaricaulota bacterium]
MFHRVLVANRGEIALRIIEACRELSMEAIAVYSEADREMPYLRLAHQSICIGPASAARSYANEAAVLSAAKMAGAQAIHPGYGFLSENPEFVELCEQHGYVFVGPSQQTMKLLGDKAAARTAVIAAGVPVLPGGLLEEERESAEDMADRIGYPVLVKAVFGGGGRGMRWVDNPSELPPAIAAARSEAKAATGSARLYMEKAVRDPRHVEVQILADHHGTIIHLGERECSVQRRHQKLIEESPAPRLSETTRCALHEAALAASRAVDYANAGTVEFVLADDERFYFIEMNARIQVEHPVSEAVTGIQLVKEQLRIATGAPLGYGQEAVQVRGHAIECRINAEDPQRGFMPSSGTVTLEELPGGPGVRVDSHLYSGLRMTPHYDSLLAKLVTHGRDREEARIRMYTALQRFRVSGVATTCAVAQRIISDPDFRDARITTSFLAKRFP